MKISHRLHLDWLHRHLSRLKDLAASFVLARRRLDEGGEFIRPGLLGIAVDDFEDGVERLALMNCWASTNGPAQCNLL